MTKKYAGLPDLDPAPEIYETPDLTDDSSTIQTGTLRSTSPTLSDDSQRRPDTRLDRQRIDQDQARKRFEPSVIDARNVNFSDSIAGDRQSYSTASRRRRKPGVLQAGLDEEDDGEEEESLGQKLARLRREAEEIRLELERREADEFQDANEEQTSDLEKDARELEHVLEGLKANTGSHARSSEEENLLRQLASDHGQSLRPSDGPAQRDEQTKSSSDPSTSSTAAIASFSDRLTALEAALGVSTVSETDSIHSILPTLTALFHQVDALSSLISPHSGQPSTARVSTSASLPALDAMSSRVRALTAETDKLTLSRKAALQSLQELHEARLRHTQSAYGHQRHASTQSREGAEQAQAQARQESQLFLDEQSSKIKALYQTIPTIQSLHPLLPTVLERLKSLHVIHAGAANAKQDMDEIEARQAEVDEEIKKWKEGLGQVARGMQDHEAVMKENAEVIGGMVRRVEDRLKRLIQDG